MTTSANAAGVAASIFDMDGLLIDSEILWHEAEIEILGDLGVPLAADGCRNTKGMFVEEVTELVNGRADRGGRERCDEDAPPTQPPLDPEAYAAPPAPARPATINTPAASPPKTRITCTRIVGSPPAARATPAQPGPVAIPGHEE